MAIIILMSPSCDGFFLCRALRCFQRAVGELKQVVYVDVLFALNTIVGFFLLSSVKKLCGEQTKLWRLLLGSTMGGVYSLVIFLPELHPVFNLFTRAVFLLLLTFAVFGAGSLRRFFRLFAAACAVTFLFAGAAVAVWLLFKPGGLVIRNGSVYFDIGFLPLVSGAAACYSAARLFSLVLARRTHEKAQCTVTVQTACSSVTAMAVVDTGNTLVDMFTGERVNVITRALALRLRPDYAQVILDPLCGSLPSGVRLIPAGTVGGDGLLPSFNVQRLLIKTPERTALVENACVAVANADAFADGCEMLLNGDTLILAKKGGKGNDKTDNKKAQRAAEKVEIKAGAGALHKRAGHPAGALERQAGAGDNAPN